MDCANLGRLKGMKIHRKNGGTMGLIIKGTIPRVPPFSHEWKIQAKNMKTLDRFCFLSFDVFIRFLHLLSCS